MLIFRFRILPLTKKSSLTGTIFFREILIMEVFLRQQTLPVYLDAAGLQNIT